jgi:hypothetical protein
MVGKPVGNLTDCLKKLYLYVILYIKGVNMKKCNECGLLKELSDFHKDGKGHRSKCKKCVLEKYHPKIPKEEWKEN